MKRILIQIYLRTVLLFLCTYFSFFPAWAMAKPIHQGVSAPLSDALPVLLPGQTQTGWSTTTDQANHYLEVQQTESKVVISWQSYDIGADAHVHYEQGQNGIALNRIYNNDPSRIFGQLTATGSIYLVNQNGILFGENSRVNLNSLVASSLNIKDENFQNGLWKYQAENYMGSLGYQEPGDVENRGVIESNPGGRIFLLGSNVQNSGTISAEEGRVILAAGQEFDLEQKATTSGIKETLTADYTGEAVNTQSGQILADIGEVGIYGRIVRHDGLIRTVSTVKAGSSITLKASEKVSTGSNSSIDSQFRELGEEIVTTDPFPGRKINILAAEGHDILVDLSGDITFPSGILDINAGDGGRIYLSSGTSIDVSGSWVDKTAQDRVMSAQENTIELRDEFLQKNGILKGTTIYFLLNEGISIGNISEHLNSRSLSAAEMSTKGGTINLVAGSGDIIVMDKAVIDISGGGITYAGGYVQTTKLTSDGQVYDIADAPDYLTYDGLINYNDSYSEAHKTYSAAYTEGFDAGKLEMAAKKVAYEGELKASATQGLYQVNTADVVDDLGYKKSIGTLIPKGGTLIIGKAPIGERYQSVDQILDTIVVKTSIPGMDPGFDPETDLFPEDRGEETWLSDDLLGQSGLSNVTLSASKNIITEAGTSISLVPSRDPAGGLKVYARRIVHQGEVLVPGGNVVFHTVSNKTTDEYVFGSDPKVESLDYVSNEELGGPDGIVLTAGSSIRTAGEVIDNFSAYRTGSGFRSTGFLEGGNIEFLDKTLDGQGVVMEKGAALDVSGGYIMGTDRTLSDAGDAGAIKIQGPAIVLDGSLAGHSMMGQNGGSITLKALEIEVVTNGAPKLTEGYSSEKDLPDHMQGKLVMDDDRLDTTGFTSITLASLTDLTIHENVSLAPSAIKQTLSGRGQVQEQAVPLDYAGDTAISLVAGSSFSGDYNIDSDKVEYALLTIKPNASVSVAPGGDITLAGGKADISGVFTAPGGNIAVNTKSLLDTSSLLVRSDARFYAQGYVRESGRLSTGEILWEAKDGGNISFLSESALIMEEGCVVDVSGSETFLSYRRDKDKGFVSKISASEPGRISLSFRQGTDETGVSSLNAGYIGTKSLDSLKGASFSLASINIDSPLSLDDGILAGLAENGFDQLFLSSLSGIEFQGSQAIEMAEGISIDTPILIGTNEDVITLVSSYIKVANTYLPGEMVTSDASAALVIKANDIDIEGDVKIQGFSSASLTAQQDIRLSDKMINEKQYNEWDGGLTTDGDLTLTAARIYSTTGSQFTVTSSGKITILPSGVNRLDPIYSAYGKLTLIAENIEIKGVLAAPMGQIVLKADERVFLANGSVLTVAGETSVNYGRLDDESLEWYGYRYDENGKSMTANTLITGAPEKNIEITANEYIGESGAQINIEGGGSVYGYTFLSSSEGSLDPLSKLTNRYVILPNAMGDLPGKDAIYFEGNDLLPEGIYALLPESYAFIEGAVIVELQGNLNATTQVTASKEGYAMAVGYQADAGTGRHSSKAQVYTVRSASDVLSEGSYEFVGYTAGNGGSLSITANTNIFNNAVRASALSPDYRNGTLALSAKEVIVGSTPVYLGTGFNFDTVLADDQNLAGLADKLYLDAKKISDAGLWELNIGNEAVTQAIIFEENSVLTGQQINLAVAEDITLEKGAVIQATGDNASISILSTTGSLVMGEGSLIDSSYLISIDAMGLERGGDIHAGQVIKMASDNLIFADANPGNGLTLPDGLVIDEALWQSFSTLDQVWLNGRGMIGFAGDVDLAAKTAIVIDTPLLAGVTDESGKKASLDSDQVVMVNSGTKTDGKMAYARNTQLRVNADHITIGHGDVGLAGFSTVNLISQNNLTFRGAGSFTTNDAALSITSEMVTGTYWYDLGAGDDEYTYEVLDFKIDSGAGLLSMMDRSSAVAQANDNIGGRLSFVAGSIENSGTIDLSSGAILFSSADINMKAGSVVSVKGSKQDGTVYDAGSVDYESQGGTINLAYNALTDVSAGSAQGNAGTIGIRNPHGITVIEG
ncbi:MAG: filamentous hemagglutinin N-terminal domain-containing protein, partial [Pseudomonadota bacterium]